MIASGFNSSDYQVVRLETTTSGHAAGDLAQRLIGGRTVDDLAQRLTAGSGSVSLTTADTVTQRLQAAATAAPQGPDRGGQRLHVIERWYDLGDGEDRARTLAYLEQHDTLVPVLRQIAEGLPRYLPAPSLFLNYADRYTTAREMERPHLLLRVVAWVADLPDRLARWQCEVWQPTLAAQPAAGAVEIVGEE